MSPLKARQRKRRSSRGAALLVCLFMIAATSLLVVSMFDRQTAELTAVRNTADYERALYLAGAAVHHALAELEEDYSWRGTVAEGAYPGDGTYQATAVDESGGTGNVVITGVGVAGDAVRTLQVTVTGG